MKVSIIIPTYNEEKVIEDCLVSLSKQTFRDFEVIVIDDGSTDKTLEIIKNIRISKFVLRILSQRHKGPAMARNLGADNSKGKILVFIDADMTFDKDFVKNLTKPIFDKKSKGTFSKDELVANWDNVWARCLNINNNLPAKKRLPKKYPDHQKVFRAILKSEFDKVDGFSKGGYTDDWTLSEKLGYEATNAPDAIFYHKNVDTLWETFKQARWVSKREYKFGILGALVALIRTSLPVSLIIGIFKSIKSFEPRFLIFKLVYDLGIFLGILELLIIGKTSK